MFDRTNLRGSAGGGLIVRVLRLPPTGAYGGPSLRQKHTHN